MIEKNHQSGNMELGRKIAPSAFSPFSVSIGFSHLLLFPFWADGAKPEVVYDVRPTILTSIFCRCKRDDNLRELDVELTSYPLIQAPIQRILFDFVQKRLVAYFENIRCLSSIPSCLLKNCANQF